MIVMPANASGRAMPPPLTGWGLFRAPPTDTAGAPEPSLAETNQGKRMTAHLVDSDHEGVIH